MFPSIAYTCFTTSLIFARDTLTVEDVKLDLLSEDLRDQMMKMSKRRGNNS